MPRPCQLCKCLLQVSAFADYSPGGSGGDKAAAAQESQKDAPAESESGESAKAEPAQNTAGSGKEWPPHTVMGLPSLSPTMSQGTLPCLICTRARQEV